MPSKCTSKWPKAKETCAPLMISFVVLTSVSIVCTGDEMQAEARASGANTGG